MGGSESCNPSLGTPCSPWVCKGRVKLLKEEPHLAGGSLGDGIAAISPQLLFGGGFPRSAVSPTASMLHFLSLPAVPLAQRN